jgi:hypothetical protein
MAKITTNILDIRINLELSLEEAAFLHVLTGTVCGGSPIPGEIYDALDSVEQIGSLGELFSNRLKTNQNPRFD